MDPIITLNNVTIRVGGRWLLHGTHWQIRAGEHWVIWGPNGAGKTCLANTLMGLVPVVGGEIQRHYLSGPARCNGRSHLALFSAEQYHQLHQREQLLAEMRHFSGRFNETTRVIDWWQAAVASPPLKDDTFQRQIFDLFDLPALLSKPIEGLSSGEMRKLLLARTLSTDPLLLILDEPFNGLDMISRHRLSRLLDQLARTGTHLVLVTHRLSEIADFFTHVLQLEQGAVIWLGTREAFLTRRAVQATPLTRQAASGAPSGGDTATVMDAPLIRMQNVSVRLGGQLILDQVDWTVRMGQNWALIGPNGAGKSTLLALITGDQLQAYANNITLFGRPKGSGESIWELKARIGFVGDTLQARYQRSLTGFDVVCSGFFDSVGLYRHCSADQRQRAEHWIQTLALKELAGRRMARLSFGQQRLLLIARAMVKTPRLLILDEPCNGLDDTHRSRLLGLLDAIGHSGTTNLIYVSHRIEEIPACTTHRLFLERGRVIGTDIALTKFN